MTALEIAETWLRWIGGALGIVLHVLVFVGLFRGLGKKEGRSAGSTGWQRNPIVVVIAALVYIVAFYLLWRLIPIPLSPAVRWVLLVAGALLYFVGAAIMIWGRLALGEMHDLSSSTGAKLYEGHRLITSGPFAYVRNPMYVGGYLAITGGLLLFQTWLLLLFMGSFISLPMRARREEEALSAEFGQQWAEYARRVPAWIPRLGRD